jgi:hypothetical protein
MKNAAVDIIINMNINMMSMKNAAVDIIMNMNIIIMDVDVVVDTTILIVKKI